MFLPELRKKTHSLYLQCFQALAAGFPKKFSNQWSGRPHFLYLLHNVTNIWGKICYDKAGNLPNKGRNFNTETWGKIVYFLFVWLVGIGFRQNFFRVLPNFGDFGAKMSFFHYIINQKRNNFIKHCSPPCTKKPLISEMCIYIKSSLCKWGLGTRGGNDVL